MKTRLFCLGMALLLSASASAGGGGSGDKGNGGIGVVCRGSGGKIESVELLDLYEAKREGLLDDRSLQELEASLVNRESSVMWALRTAMRVASRSAPTFSDSLQRWMSETLQKLSNRDVWRSFRLDERIYLYGFPLPSPSINWMLSKAESSFHTGRTAMNSFSRKSGIDPDSRFVDTASMGEMALSSDFTPTALPAGCAFEQIATYYPDHSIRLNPELYDALGPLRQGALFFHEIVWTSQREIGMPNSDLARKLVGAVYRLMSQRLRSDAEVSSEDPVYRRAASILSLSAAMHADLTSPEARNFSYLSDGAFAEEKIRFGYRLEGESGRVRCASATDWVDWKEGKRIERVETRSHGISGAKEKGAVSQEFRSVQDLAYTSIGPRLHCELLPGFNRAKAFVDFRIYRGSRLLASRKIPIELTRRARNRDSRPAPFLFVPKKSMPE